MKPLFFLLLIISIGCKGQLPDNPHRHVNADGTEWYDLAYYPDYDGGHWRDGLKDLINPPQPQYDTIPVLLLCSDTTAHPEGIDYFEITLGGPGVNNRIDTIWTKPYSDPKTWTERGYEVGYSDHTMDANAVDLISTTYLIWHHIDYLDDKKQPLKYFVWLSKELK